MPIFKKRSVDDLGEKKRDMPEGLWTKCPSCGESLYEQALLKNLRVCGPCGYHFTMSAPERVASICDDGTFIEMDAELTSVNPLGFSGYVEKVAANQAKTGLGEAVLTGRATIESIPVLLAIMDFRFLGGSMGSVVGEKITRAIEAATAEKKPVIVFSSSGGARMHEGILSLMQMGKTSGALARHSEARLPYVSVLTHPTTGGVTASFATLGDVIVAEPGCMIGFAGARVVKETTHADLPKGFQTAEFMLQHGLLDRIIARKDMRTTLAAMLRYMSHS
jgi:acetyl-CoA carboxylase carboxyl transferase subunit beta